MNLFNMKHYFFSGPEYKVSDKTSDQTETEEFFPWPDYNVSITLIR